MSADPRPGPAGRLVTWARPEPGGGTPGQVHLTWGEDPARSVVVSWVSRGRAERPRVRIGQRVIPAAGRVWAGPGGRLTWCYHARVDGLRPGATYGYAVTADNDDCAADPFSATFTTAPAGRAAFRFTSCAAPAATGAGPVIGSGALSAEAAYAVEAVETFQPLFHLLGGGAGDAGAAAGTGAADGSGAGPGGLAPAAVRREAADSFQASAASRPWLPVPAAGAPLAAFLAGYALPPNGAGELDGRWYAFRVGTACFVSLSGDDVAYGPAGAASRGFSGGAQTRWLEATLAAARRDASVDWIVVQLRPCACCSGPADACDLGVRRAWLPLFDAYEVDLVLAGPGHGYERSFPVRGTDPAVAPAVAAADTQRPHPVTTVDGGAFDTSQGTVHLVLGTGAGRAGGPAAGPAAGFAVPRPARPAGSGPLAAAFPPVARVVTRPAPAEPGAAALAAEPATWSARRDLSGGYGIAVFDLDPGTEAGGQTSITVRYYHAGSAGHPGPATSPGGAPGAGDYTLLETFTLVRPRSDGRRWHLRG